LNVGLLSIFKYGDFIIESLNVFNLGIKPMNLGLPIGISFYTFQTMSYTIDVYRRKTKASSSYLDYMMYVSMFVQLIAGPIVKYKDIKESISNRIHSVDKFHEGINRFVSGLAKKVLIADQLAGLHQLLSTSQSSFVGTWIMLLSYGFHIYYDFSGYSDMAIGLGKMFGFDFLENFNYPFISRSVSEFWQRWHISLGSWFKEYLYFPLGGSRGKTLNTVRNLFIVWALTGLWHGASLNFVIWGLYFFVFIALEKLIGDKINPPDWVKHIYLLIVVSLSWILFSVENLGDQLHIFKAAFNIIDFVNKESIYYILSYGVIFILAIALAVPYKYKMNERVKGWLMIIIFMVTLTYIVDSSFSPFIYFRF
jgi:alginate O-acetyltransferase complex protein AlgI